MALYGGIEMPGCPDAENVRRLDLLALPMIRRMHHYGMAIDKPYFADLSARFAAEMAELEKQISSYIPPDRLRDFAIHSAEIEEEEGDASINPASAEQVSMLLFEILNVGDGQKLKRTKTGQIATGKKQLELLASAEQPVVRLILTYRELSKLKSGYTDSLPLMAKYHARGADCAVCGLTHDIESWRVHGQIGTTRAATGRLNHKAPNNANIPSRSVNGGLVRGGYIAPSGKRLVSRDLSQIELRGLAHCANAASMIKVYQEDRDIHVFTACAAFDLDEQHITQLITLDKQHAISVAQQVELDDFKLHNRLPSKNLNFMICVAGGQRVLTNHGLIPIERVTIADLVWDGVEYVQHDGVVCNGWQKVISYDGLTATPDHKVWTREGQTLRLAQANAGHARLACSGIEETPVRYTADRIGHWAESRADSYACQAGSVVAEDIRANTTETMAQVYDIINAGARCRFTCEGKLVSNCYGATVVGLLAQCALSGLMWSEDEGNRFIQRWFNLYPEVHEYMELQHYRARRYGMVWDLFGRVRLIPEMQSYHEWIKSAGLRQAGNMPIQSLAAGQMKLAMGRSEEMLLGMERCGVHCVPLTSIHDQLMIEADEDSVDDVQDALQIALDECMDDVQSGEHRFRVPIKSEGESMIRWKK